MSKIGVIGANGYVGKGMVNLFKDHYDVVKYDPALKDSATKEEVNECILAVICVPTNMLPDGSCDISIVEEVVSWIDVPMWIRSTVSVGTTDYLKEKYNKRLVFSPEYLGESSYWTDWEFHNNEKACPFILLGGDKKDTQYILDIVIPIVGPTKQIRQLTPKEAEMAKYMENIYFAMKVTFANEIRQACDALGVNYWEARSGWGLDPRVDIMHTAAFPQKKGFAGKCLPKDIMAFIRTCEKVGYDPKFLKEIVESNKRFKEYGK